MRVTWSTSNVGALVTPGEVHFGTTVDQNENPVGTWSIAAANLNSYNQTDLCGAPANSLGFSSAGVINMAVMTGLQSNTRYYYRVGHAKVGFTEVRAPASPLKLSLHDIPLFILCRLSPS